MRGVRLHNHGATSGKCTRRVAARNGEGEGKIARTEDNHRSKRDQHSSQIGARQWLAVRQGGVDTRVAPGAFARHFRKESQLADRAAALTGEAIQRQARLAVRALEQFVAEREDFLRDLFEESCACFAAEFSRGDEGVIRKVHRAIHIVVGCFVNRWFESLPIERADGMKGACA